MTDINILQGLNPPQKEAVETTEGPLLILAGPGSGKTRVVAHRIAYLIRNCRIPPYRILAVTFTNKAAREMEERIRSLVGSSTRDMTLGTFHAICSRILRRERNRVGLDADFVIYDDDDQLDLIKNILKELNIDNKRFYPRTVQSQISAAKSQLLTPAEYAGCISSYFEEVITRVYERYQELLLQNNALDFDDLIMHTVLLFREHPDLLATYQERYLHIHVDEFQDTNLAQYALIKQLAEKHRNICVVGDPDQSIYSWRSADLRNILNFEKDYPDARMVVLEQNYRSTKIILQAAQQVISNNIQRKEKNLWTENEEGVPITIGQLYSEQEEAQFIVSEVEKFIEKSTARLGDCAVMYRTNAQSRAIEEAFLRHNMAYQLIGGTRFYERREIKDITAYLKFIYNPRDNVNLLRIINIPGRGIGKQTLSELTRWAKGKNISLYAALQLLAQRKMETPSPFSPRMEKPLLEFQAAMENIITGSYKLPVADLIDKLLTAIAYQKYILAEENGEERWDNILELCSVAAQYQGDNPRDDLAAFLERTALVSDIDTLEEKPDAVTLITLHQTKGLEFPIVFITGMEEGVFPHIKSFDDPAQMEEERRLCYVGMTRAKKGLYLLHAIHRNLAGRSTINPPTSRFIEDISSELVKSINVHESESTKTEFAATGNKPVPQTGDHVRHAIFGDGMVINCSPIPGDYEVNVAFGRDVGIKKLLLSLAPMEVTNTLTAPVISPDSDN